LTTPPPSLGLLAGAPSAIVADALDRLGRREQALDPAIRPLWPQARLAGRAMPVVVRCSTELPDPPYESEIQALEALGPGDIAVFEVERTSRAATWGELFSCAAMGAGAVGVVVDGCIRDAAQIEELGFPTFARATSPLDTLGRATVVSFGEQATCGGVVVRRGDVVVGDVDGVVVIPAALVDDVVRAIETKGSLEASARADLLAGLSLREVWDRYEVL
jgi:regulator of RNase E activity RraA